jgi:hypothetical protein
MCEITPRNNEIYMRIEKFKEYEYTNCIVHEMKERSIGINPIEIQKIYDEKSKGYSDTSLDVSHVRLSSRSSLRDYVFNIFPSLYNDLLKEIKNKHEKLAEDKLKQIILNGPIPIKYLIQEYINKDNISFIEIIYSNDEGVMETLTKDKLKGIIEKTNFAHSLIPNFGYLRIFPKDYKFIVLYDINLALPLNELIAYIKKIKDDFDTNKFVLDTPSEMMKNDYSNKKICSKNETILRRYKKIEVFKKNKEKKNEINTFKILSSRTKVADMFYIYDQEEKGFTKKEILNELIDYHSTFDSDRYDNYLLTAEKYIDEEYYLNLIK